MPEYPTILHYWISIALFSLFIVRAIWYIVLVLVHLLVRDDFDVWTRSESSWNWGFFNWYTGFFLLFMAGTKVPPVTHPWEGVGFSAVLGIGLVFMAIIWIRHHRKPTDDLYSCWVRIDRMAQASYDDIPSVYGEGI